VNTKALLGVEIKNEDQGIVEAIFSTFDKIDSDGDVTRPGAFEDGAEVPISAYGHTSWEGLLPVGKGRIRTTATQAIVEAKFFMNTAAGRDTFTTLKELGELGQWSYGYDPVEYSFGEFEGQRVRFLDKLKVHEVSPVLVGAGVNTRTLAAKSAGREQAARPGRPIAPHDTAVVNRSWDGAKTLGGLGDGLRPSELRTVFAWVDPDGDPEHKSSYRYAHHHGVGGPANIRACLMGIARLNDAAKAGIPDADRTAVYEHLAAHLRDADVEVPELKNGPTGSLKFHEEGHAVLAAVAAYIDRASEVLALRRAKGRTGLAPSSAELLGWVEDEMRRLKSLLDTPTGDEDPSEEEILRTLMAATARVHGI